MSIQGLVLQRHLPYGGTCDEPGVVVRRGLAGKAGLAFGDRSLKEGPVRRGNVSGTFGG